MNRKQISKAISDIQDSIIAETMFPPVPHAKNAPERTKNMGKYERRNGGNPSRKLMVLILAACLVFSIAVTAYAANLWGIRELFRTHTRELPEGADSFIQQHTETVQAEDWSARIMESLCDGNKILLTVAVSGGDQYILAPTDAMPSDTVGLIGLSGDETLESYAASQGKQLLFVGTSLLRNEKLGIFTESQRNQPISPSEMVILLTSERTNSEPAGDVICRVYADETDGTHKVLELPLTLTETPTEGERIFVPLDPDAIPGLTVGEATIQETPLGYNIRWMETITDQDAYYNIMKVDFDEIANVEGGGAVLADDGNWYFQTSMGQGNITDTLTVHFYDWDKQPIGDIVFKQK